MNHFRLISQVPWKTLFIKSCLIGVTATRLGERHVGQVENWVVIRLLHLRKISTNYLWKESAVCWGIYHTISHYKIVKEIIQIWSNRSTGRLKTRLFITVHRTSFNEKLLENRVTANFLHEKSKISIWSVYKYIAWYNA